MKNNSKFIADEQTNLQTYKWLDRAYTADAQPQMTVELTHVTHLRSSSYTY